MIPASFEYHAPEDLREVVALLRRYPDDCKVMAGGQSLIPIMKLRLASPAHVVDLGRIKGLAYIDERDDGLHIGPMTTYVMLESSPVVRRKVPALAEAAGLVADVQVRNRGTIGGSAAHADPAADLPAVLVAAEADFHISGGTRDRVVPAGDFFIDVFTTALEPTEVAREIVVPPQPPATGSCYQKFANKASRFAIAGVAAFVALDGEGRCAYVRIGITGAGPNAKRAIAAERALQGKEPTEANLRSAASRAGDGIEFLDDLHGSPEYRENLTEVLTYRALAEAVTRADKTLSSEREG